MLQALDVLYGTRERKEYGNRPAPTHLLPPPPLSSMLKDCVVLDWRGRVRVRVRVGVGVRVRARVGFDHDARAAAERPCGWADRVHLRRRVVVVACVATPELLRIVRHPHRHGGMPHKRRATQHQAVQG